MNPITPVRILLVEDDDEDVAIFRKYMNAIRRHTAAIVRARDAAEARALLDGNSFDLVCVDLNLGGGDSGLDLLREVRACPTGPPVVVVTGSGDEEKAAETMRCGASDYLLKDRLSAELLDRTIRTVREKHLLEHERRQMMMKLAELSITDDLTGLANRRHLMAKLDEELIRSNRTGHLFSLLVIDLDDFKAVNDRCGHLAGDNALRTCAGALTQNLRATDFIARHGGDEFCVLLPDTPTLGAERVAEKLRYAVESLPDPVPTASIGIAFWRPETCRDKILREADNALYEAKHRGRNCVVVSKAAEPELGRPWDTIGAARTDR